MPSQYLVNSRRNGRRTHQIKVWEEKTSRNWISGLTCAFLHLVPFSVLSVLGAVVLREAIMEGSALLAVCSAVSLTLGWLVGGIGTVETRYQLIPQTRDSFKTYESFLGLAWRPVNARGKNTDHVSSAFSDQLAERFADHDHSDVMEWKVW